MSADEFDVQLSVTRFTCVSAKSAARTRVRGEREGALFAAAFLFRVACLWKSALILPDLAGISRILPPPNSGGTAVASSLQRDGGVQLVHSTVSKSLLPLPRDRFSALSTLKLWSTLCRPRWWLKNEGFGETFVCFPRFLYKVQRRCVSEKCDCSFFLVS